MLDLSCTKLELQYFQDEGIDLSTEQRSIADTGMTNNERAMIYGVFDIIVYMFSNWFLSLYRVFLVLFESLQVWSCTG